MLTGLVASWHDRTQGRQDALQDHQLGRVQRRAQSRGSLTIWLDKDMPWYAPASGKRGRQRIFSEAAIPFCLSIKCLFNLALCQSLDLVESLLRLAGLDWSVPDLSTVCRRQKTLRVQLPYRASTTPLNLLMDSTGIKFLGEGE